MEGTKLATLPDEVIVQILLRVPLPSFRAINSTCKYWQSILARREFWKYLSKLIWGDKSTPSSDLASTTEKIPIIPGEQLVDWKEYFKIRSKLDGIASIMNALQGDFTPISLDADLDTKIEMISNNLRDQMLPVVDEEDAIEGLLNVVVSCCDLSYSFSTLGLSWLINVAAQYFTALGKRPELLRKILKTTKEVLLHSTEEHKQLVIEFWSSVCDQELDYREDDETETGNDNASLFIGSCCQDLVPLLLRAISDEKYATTELNDWNVRQAAETCLQQLTSVVLDDIVPFVEPILRQDLNSEDWRRRDIALEILGLIFTDRHYDYVEKNAASYLLQVLDSLKFNHVRVRESAAWALSQICRSYAEEVKVHNKLLSKAVLAALSDEKSVREYIYTCIANYTGVETENPFAEDFFKLIQVLNASVPASRDNSLMIYEAMASLIGVQENVEPIRPLVPVIVQNMKEDINANGVASALMRNFPEAMAPYVHELMTMYLTHMQTEVTEEVMIAIGNIATASGERFVTYLPALMPLILPLLNDVQDTTTFSVVVGLLGDICLGTQGGITPYCDTIMQSILAVLANPALDRNTRPPIVALFGDIAVAIGADAFEKYLPSVVKVLKQAGEVMARLQDDLNDVEMEDYFAELQSSWFSAFSSLFQTYRKNSNALQLLECTPIILTAVINTVNASIDSKNASTAIWLVGDIIQCIDREEIIKGLSQRQDLNQCLMLALDGTDENLVEAAKWVLKLLKN